MMTKDFELVVLIFDTVESEDQKIYLVFCVG